MAKPYQNIIFISKPRCASTSVFNYLYEWDDNINGSKPMYHILGKNMKGRLPNWDKTFSFGIVRNPYELCRSWYFHHKHTPKVPQEVKDFYPDTFEEWVNNDFPTHWAKNHKWPTNPLKQKQWLYNGDDLLVNKVIKIEEINDEFEEVKKIVNSEKELTINNPSNKKEINNSLLNKIYNYFKEDFITFKYNKKYGNL